MIFSKLFSWSPMVKRAKAARQDVAEAKAASIEAHMESKQAEATMREALGMAEKTREIVKKNHFSPHIEELFKGGYRA